MGEILKELIEIKELLQTIASSLEHRELPLKIDAKRFGKAIHGSVQENPREINKEMVR